ncbi:hypothetical protein TIFTF001_027825 [Ficus carica]|uniref:Uncharacterized protein n=1 Tax=Ficus carica TaxID=3494 RepID=A0AA88DNN0_FICCA|nr:hypothetical protein TIFTF001_027825 [Ficus carica]
MDETSSHGCGLACQWLNSRTEFASCLISKFSNLYGTPPNPVELNLKNILQGGIPNEDNTHLASIPYAEEIKDIVFRMGDIKALGPDGMPIVF